MPVIYALPSFDDPERATSKVAKAVVLDLNDPKLLVDIHESQRTSKRARQYGGILKRRLSGSRTRDLSRRYNISNDVAYEQLKENQSKVRSTIGNLAVEHSMPALRLQYPYVRTRQCKAYSPLLTISSIKPNSGSEKRAHSIALSSLSGQTKWSVLRSSASLSGSMSKGEPRRAFSVVPGTSPLLIIRTHSFWNIQRSILR